MAFIIKGNPTIDAKVTIKGQGITQVLELTFRNKTPEEYDALVTEIEAGGRPSAGLLLELIERWEADMPLDEAAIEVLRQYQPGAELAILQAYHEARMVEREKN